MAKILVVARSLNKGGGISEWLINYYNELVQYEDLEVELLIEEEFNNIDQFKIHPNLSISKGISLTRNPIKYYFFWKKVNKKNISGEWDYIHFHVDNLVRFFNILILRKSKNIIIHSHSSFNIEVKESKIKGFLHFIGKKIIKKSDAILFSCSDLAAKWLFDDSEYIQLNNGIDLNDFIFDYEKRERYRKEINLSGKIVYGHVGRFTYQKNHKKLIDIFSKIVIKETNAVLVLVGEGEEKQEIISYLEKLRLSEKVIFLGLRSDVSNLINAFDKIIFPSYYEGFPLVLVEAQANGIPVYFSDTITKNAKLLEESKLFLLNEENETIADFITGFPLKKDRNKAIEILKERGYEKKDIVEYLYKFYTGKRIVK